MLERYGVYNMLAAALSLVLAARLGALPPPERKRLALASALAGLSATAALRWPGLAIPSLCTLPLGAALCYGMHGRQAAARATLLALAGAALLAGLGTLLLGWLPRAGAWAALPALALLLPLLRLMPSACREVTQIELRRGDCQALLPAMLDTGNLLVDALSGLPVVVIGRRAAEAFFPPERLRKLQLLRELPPGVRLLRVRTAAGHALLPVFRPDRLTLYRDGQPCEAAAMVAIAPEDYAGVQALVPAAALSACAPGPVPAPCRAPLPRRTI